MTRETLAVDVGKAIAIVERARGTAPRRVLARMMVKRHSRGVLLVEVECDDGFDAAVFTPSLAGQRALFESDQGRAGDGSTPAA